jgi:glycerol-3-phosphate dehydrogenase
MQSVWTDSVNFPNFDKLKKDIRTDVLIIGGGITGLLCAYQLQQSGVDYVLVEKDHMPLS